MTRDLQKEWNSLSGRLENLGAGPLPGANPNPDQEDEELKDAAKEIVKIVLIALLDLPQNEIRGRQIDWIQTIADFAWKHKIGL